MKHSEQLNELSTALAKSQAVMGGAMKSATNPFFKSKYADLSSCVEACRKALTDHGISVIQGNTPHDGGVQVQTRLMHSSGQWVEDDGLFVPANKADAQGFGSALTYARRYSLCAMVGIAPEDDDGNAASSAITATGAMKESGQHLSTDQRNAMVDLASEITGMVKDGKVAEAVAQLASFELDNDEKLFMWSEMDSKTRSAIKSHKGAK